MFTVYVIKSKSTGKCYTGQTGNLSRRLLEHQSGLARYSRGRGPWELIIIEEYDTRTKAMSRERFLKSGKGRLFIKEQLSSRAGPPEAD